MDEVSKAPADPSGRAGHDVPGKAPMNEFAYTTYISTTPEKLWRSFETDWEKARR